MTPALASYSDLLQGNLHPYFSGTPAINAANWTINEYATTITANPVPSGTTGVISEVGWPSAPSTAVYRESFFYFLFGPLLYVANQVSNLLIYFFSFY